MAGGAVMVAMPVRRFVVWRSGVAVLTAAAIASVTAWTFSRWQWPVAAQVAVAGGSAALLIALALSLCQVPAGVLRGRAGHWCFEADAASPMPALAVPAATDVELEVALDLGSFLLLRLHRPAAGERDRPGRRRHWLPVERRGLEADWQAFRRAVYSPRPAPGTAAAAAGQTPSE